MIRTLLALALAVPTLAAAQTVTFTPTSGVQTYDVREPVLRIAPGTTVVSETYSFPGDYYEGGAWAGEVGPFYIEGAEPGDTLVVRILRVQPNRDSAISRYGPYNISGVAGDMRTRMLNDPLPARTFHWRLDRQRMVGILDLPNSASDQIELPLRPMLGRVAVAPANGEAYIGLWPGDFGGNMDAADVREGATVYLPVFNEGALFYFGDGHALQGDGEIIGSGLETTMDVTLHFELIKGQAIRWPRIEDETHIMVAGSARPLVDAMRIAYVELIEWLMADYGFEKMEAFQVASQIGEVRVANIVDPIYTVVAKFPKASLPPRR